MRSAGQRGMGRGFLWSVVVGNAVLGGALTVVALAVLVVPSQRVWAVGTSLLTAAAGVVWVGVGSVGFHRMYLRRTPADGRRVLTETVDGRPAVVLRWSSTLVTMPLLTVGALAGLALAAGIALRGHGAAGPFVVFGGALALLLPDAWARTRRRTFLRLDERGVTARGWDGESFLAWDDIGGATLADVGQWSVVRFVGRPGGPSFTWRRRRRFLFAPAPAGPCVDVPAPALDVDPYALAGTVLYYARTPSARTEIADGTARRRLVERLQPAR